SNQRTNLVCRHRGARGALSGRAIAFLAARLSSRTDEMSRARNSKAVPAKSVAPSGHHRPAHSRPDGTDTLNQPHAQTRDPSSEVLDQGLSARGALADRLRDLKLHRIESVRLRTAVGLGCKTAVHLWVLGNALRRGRNHVAGSLQQTPQAALAEYC